MSEREKTENSRRDCFTSVLECSRCFTKNDDNLENDLLAGPPEYIPIRSFKSNAFHLTSSEEDAQLKDRLRKERAKAAWKRLSRKKATDSESEISVEGMKKVAEALIKAANKNDKVSLKNRQGLDFVPKLSTNENSAEEFTLKRNEIETGRLTSLRKAHSENLQSIPKPFDLSNSQGSVDSSVEDWSKNLDINIPTRDSVFPHSSASPIPSSRFIMSNSYADSPRLSQSQLLLAKLGEVSDMKGNLTPRKSSPKSPARKAEGKSFGDLQIEAYEAVSQDNESRIRRELKKHSSDS